MVCNARSASLSVRHRRPRSILPSPSPLAVLDLSKPAERGAYDFLCRATSKRDRFWRLLDMRRLGSTLLCVVQWNYPGRAAQSFSIAEVSLTESAVCWRYYTTADAARIEMLRRCCGQTVTQKQTI